MKIIIYILSFCFLVILLGCSTADEKQKPDEKKTKTITISSKASSILSGLGYKNIGNKNSLNDISVSLNGDIETIKFTPAVIMSDGMTQVIKIDHKTRKYWVTVSGGIGGVYQEKGPFEFN